MYQNTLSVAQLFEHFATFVHLKAHLNQVYCYLQQMENIFHWMQMAAIITN